MKVLTVPMRNGNLLQLLECLRNHQVLTVPMRNGNYGEASGTIYGIGSYRTYEEWKHANGMITPKACLVLTVPMRNGNKVNGNDAKMNAWFLPYL